jgi:hypothetical protein
MTTLDTTNCDMASLAFIKMIDPATSTSERRTLRKNLLAYCARDTQALVRLAHHFQGQ